MERHPKAAEAYRAFLEFVGNDVQKERHRTNRRMLSVALWCFVAPAIVSIALLTLIKFGVLPRRARANLDWLMLVFPVLYSLYILSSEVLTGIPTIFRRGGLVGSLKQSEQEGDWRERVCDSIRESLQFNDPQWEWVLASFKIDLENIRHRTKYLTGLAGAVFFLVMQGIDSMGTDSESVWLKNPLQGWAAATNDISSLMALALFLVLLYLSGSQTYHALSRYHACAELAWLRQRQNPKM